VGVVVPVHRDGEMHGNIDRIQLTRRRYDCSRNPAGRSGALLPTRYGFPARGRLSAEAHSQPGRLKPASGSPSPFDTTAASIRSPVTFRVVRHMSRKRSTPRIRPMPSGGTPTITADQRDHRQRAGGHAGGADAAQDADQHHRDLLLPGSDRRRRTGPGTAPSRPRTRRCRSGWRWRRRSARSARSSSAGAASPRQTRSDTGNVALLDAVENAITIASLRPVEEFERRPAAEEFQTISE
jgi:hypothetical protein